MEKKEWVQNKDMKVGSCWRGVLLAGEKKGQIKDRWKDRRH